MKSEEPGKYCSDDFQVDVGRADGGRTFVRVTHIPTGKERVQRGLGNADAFQIARNFIRELIELNIETPL